MKDGYQKKNPLLRRVPHTVVVTLVFFVIIPAIGFGFWYGYESINQLSTQIDDLSKNVNKLEVNLASEISSLKKDMEDTEDSLQREIENTSDRVSEFQDRIGSVSNKVTDLEKLTKTDPELLKKYSRTYFLNENYIPSDLVKIPKRYTYYEDRDYQFHTKVWPFLQKMLEEAEDDDIEMYIYSAYRSFDTQSVLKGNYEMIYGQKEANQFSAYQGYSEHQLGTTVDLITPGIDGTLFGFDKTDAHEWLSENAYKYGFILSYPEGNEYFEYEPWHWRFVGVKLAKYLKGTDQHFYDLSQRKIDEYLISLFEEE